MTKNYNRRLAKEYGWFNSMFYILFLHTVVDFVFNVFYDYKIYGKENVPQGKNYIYAGNHVSYFDPPSVAFATRKKIAFMAKDKLFDPKQEKVYWFVRHLGAFAVNREKPAISTFKTIRDILKTKWSLGIFPQGDIFSYGIKLDVKKGFVVIAKTAKADIVPIAIDFPGYPIFFKKQPLNIYIGKPISYKLKDEEIISQWCKFITDHVNYLK